MDKKIYLLSNEGNFYKKKNIVIFFLMDSRDLQLQV